MRNQNYIIFSIAILIIAIILFGIYSGTREGSVEISFEPGSEEASGKMIRIYDLEGNLVTEKQISNLSEKLTFCLEPKDYVAKVEGLCPPGYNEQNFTINAGKITKISFFIRICV